MKKNSEENGTTNANTDSGIHVVRIYGGLGNQLFQYALYKTFELMGYKTYADLADMENGECDRNYQLNYLGVNIQRVPKEYIKSFFSLNKVSKAIIKRIGKKTYYRQRDLVFDRSILDAERGYFDGYWQSYKYFEEFSGLIKESIVFPKIDDDDFNALEIFRHIHNTTNAVSIHIRLGDYINLSDIYGDICTIDYYERATSYITKELKKRGEEAPTFFVFSNDIDQARKILGDKDFIYVEGHDEDNGYIDMGLMSICKHHIIANSSFSWWGAYLGQYKESIIISPENWIKGTSSKDIVPANWNRM